MWRRGIHRHRRAPQVGQAAVELLGVLPVLVALALAGWLVVRAAHEWTVAGSAARVAARAHEVGADPQRAARPVLDAGRAGRTRVATGITPAGAPRVVVTIRPPRAGGWAAPPAVRGAAATAAGGAVR